MTALCPYGETGCPDNEGDYDIVMPEPMSGTSGAGYKVRVMDIDDEEDADCSDEFYLLASDEAPAVGDSDGPFLEVTSPSDGDVAVAGEEYTVEVRDTEAEAGGGAGYEGLYVLVQMPPILRHFSSSLKKGIGVDYSCTTLR